MLGVTITTSLIASGTVRSSSKNTRISAIVDSSGNINSTYNATINNITSSAEFKKIFNTSGKNNLDNKIKELSSVSKYGNVSLGTSVEFPNAISSSMTIDSNEITLSDTGVAEQISLEFKAKVSFDGPDSNIFKLFSNIRITVEMISALVFAILLVLLLYYGAWTGLTALLLLIIKL